MLRGLVEARFRRREDDILSRVRADPALIPDFVEEMLRRYGISSLLRFVTQDAEFRGVKLTKGERMHVLLHAGNLDVQAYPEPDRMKLGREEPFTTFGIGVHRDLGSHLARIDLRALFEDMQGNWPTFGLDPDDPSTESAGIVYSVDRLPPVWAAPQEG